MTYPHEQLAANPHDRTAQHRADDAWLEQRWSDPQTRVLVVSGTRVRPRDGAIDWVSPQEAPDGLRVLLGEQAGRAWFAVIVDAEVSMAAEQGEWTPLRGVLPHLADDALASAPLVFHALGLAEWLFVTRFCPRCASRSARAGPATSCPAPTGTRSSRARTRR